jgi:GT2 family glycosyltransferase
MKSYSENYNVLAKNSDVTSDQFSQADLIKYFILGKKFSEGEMLFAPSCTLAVKRSSFLKIGGFDVSMRRLEDIDLACRAIESGLVLCWTSAIALTRSVTVGADKSGTANAIGERQIIEKFRESFSKSEYLIAKYMSYLRQAYFEKSYFRILLLLPILPIVLFSDITKLRSILNRMRHDVWIAS